VGEGEGGRSGPRVRLRLVQRFGLQLWGVDATGARSAGGRVGGVLTRSRSRRRPCSGSVVEEAVGEGWAVSLGLGAEVRRYIRVPALRADRRGTDTLCWSVSLTIAALG
jgi:hypothetical protein